MENNLAQFENQAYLNLETFRKSGDAVKTPVWFVQSDDKFYVRTVDTSGKIKRIRNNSQVNIMPCGQTGEPLGDWIPARARETTDEVTFALVRGLLVEKYTADMVAMFEARTRASGLVYTTILIEPGA